MLKKCKKKDCLNLPASSFESLLKESPHEVVEI